MNRKLLGNITALTLAWSGLAAAGDITANKSSASYVQIVNNEVLNCQDVNCTGANGTGSPVGGELTLSGPTASRDLAFLSNSNAALAMQRLSSLLALDPTNNPDGALAAAPAPAPVITGSSTSASSQGGDSFVLSGDQVMGVAAADSTAASTPATAFSDPIISPSFNWISTVFVATVAPSSGQSNPSNSSKQPGLPSSTTNAAGSSASTGTSSYTTGDSSYVDTASTSTVTGDTIGAAPSFPSSPGGAGFTSFSYSGGSSGALSLSATQGMTAPPSDAPEPSADLLIGAGLVAAGVFTRVARQGK